MKKSTLQFLLLIPMAWFLSSCTETVQPIEVTRFVPQTVEVTKIIPQTVVVTQTFQSTATRIPGTHMPGEIKAEPDQSTAYFDGVIVLAQYYTLLDQKLYEQAYQYLSDSKPDAKTLEEFAAGHEAINIYAYRLMTAQPYSQWAEEQGFTPSPDVQTKKRFYMRVYAEGEGGMAGSVTDGVHTFFATLTWENGEWRIYSISTSP